MAEIFQVFALAAEAPYTQDANNIGQLVGCGTHVDEQSYYLFLVIPAILLTAVLSFTQKRKSCRLDILQGRPGLVYPMNFLGRSKRFIYGAAYGAITYLCMKLVFEQRYVITYHGPEELKVFILILSVLVYGIDFYPLFAALAVDTLIGYIIGTLYSLVITIVFFIQTFKCDVTYSASTVMLTLLNLLPILICLICTTVGFPIRMGLFIRDNILNADKNTSTYLENIRNSYHGKHVRRLMQKIQPSKPDIASLSRGRKLFRRIKDWIYIRDPNFRYSTRIVSVIIMGFIVMYTAAAQFLILGVLVFDRAKNQFAALQPGSLQYATVASSVKLFDVLKDCWIVSCLFPFIIGILNILHFLRSYREDLQALYRGNHDTIPKPTKKRLANTSLLAGSVRYAGYQVGYIAWAYVVQAAVIFLITFALAAFIHSDHLKAVFVRILLQFLTTLASAIGIIILQMVLSRYLFLQNEAHDLVINNRRGFFMFTYFMFFYNMFIGVMSCVLRIIKATGIGLFFLSRLDKSNLPERFQFLDPGFKSYIGFMSVESAHTNPIMMTFVKLLLPQTKSNHLPPPTPSDKRGNLRYLMNNSLDFRKRVDEESGPFTDLKSKVIRNRWHLSYTLLKNSQLRLFRKHNLAPEKSPSVFANRIYEVKQ